MANFNDTMVSRNEFIALETNVKELHEDVRELHKTYDLINKQTVATEKLATEMKFMREKQDSMEERLRGLENVPKKRYEGVIVSIINTIIALVIGAIAAMIGLKN